MGSQMKKSIGGSIHRIREFELEKVNLAEEFDILQIVGEGWFGKILLVEHRATDTEMVLKALPKAYTALRDFYREFHYGLHLGAHRNIITTYDVAFETPGFYVFAQEYAPLGDLTSNVSETGIGELHSKRVARQLAAALEHLHARDLVHRDVKLDNVLVFKSDFSRVKLCDFGETRRAGTIVRRRNEWLPYAPPEVLQTDNDCNYKCETNHDVWQFGIVIFVCLTGCLPWQKAAHDDPRYMRFITWHSSAMSPIRKQPKLFKLVSSKAQRFFRKFLEPKPEKRPATLSDLHRYTDDRWLAKGIPEKNTASTAEDDGLCPSMYSFHSSPEEKNKLLFTLTQYGIETTVDRTAKKDRIRAWIQNSVIEEENEEEEETEEDVNIRDNETGPAGERMQNRGPIEDRRMSSSTSNQTNSSNQSGYPNKDGNINIPSQNGGIVNKIENNKNQIVPATQKESPVETVMSRQNGVIASNPTRTVASSVVQQNGKLSGRRSTSVEKPVPPKRKHEKHGSSSHRNRSSKNEKYTPPIDPRVPLEYQRLNTTNNVTKSSGGTKMNASTSTTKPPPIIANPNSFLANIPDPVQGAPKLHNGAGPENVKYDTPNSNTASQDNVSKNLNENVSDSLFDTSAQNNVSNLKNYSKLTNYLSNISNHIFPNSVNAPNHIELKNIGLESSDIPVETEKSINDTVTNSFNGNDANKHTNDVFDQGSSNQCSANKPENNVKPNTILNHNDTHENGISNQINPNYINKNIFLPNIPSLLHIKKSNNNNNTKSNHPLTPLKPITESESAQSSVSGLNEALANATLLARAISSVNLEKKVLEKRNKLEQNNKMLDYNSVSRQSSFRVIKYGYGLDETYSERKVREKKYIHEPKHVTFYGLSSGGSSARSGSK